MNTLDYENTLRTAARIRGIRRILRRTILAILIVSVFWCATAFGRVLTAHVVLGYRIRHGTATGNSDPRRLNRSLIWSRSVKPLLKRPWKAVILYYPNGYASSKAVKVP